jgi:dephospho-CoA kinase
VAAIAARFGRGVLTDDGAVDRKRLAALVFADADARRDLEAILHPAVYAAIDAWMGRQQAAGVDLAVAEIPLLFETGHAADFDRVVATVCEADQQVARAAARGGDVADIRRRLAAQWPAEEKARRAHLVIRTDGTLADTRAAADAALDRLRAGAADEA